MSKSNQSPFNFYQQRAIQTLKHLSKSYSEEILIDSLFSKSNTSNSNKEVYYILDDLKKNVSIEDLTSFLYNLMNGETYDTILFSSEMQSSLSPKVLIKKIEEDEKIEDDSYNIKKGQLFKNENININNENLNNLDRSKIKKSNGNNNIIRIKINNEKDEKYDGKKFNICLNKYNQSIQVLKMLNKPIRKFNTNKSLEISNYQDNKSNTLEYISSCHKESIVKYNNILKKLIVSKNLGFDDFMEFSNIRKKINRLMRKKSCKKIKEEILKGQGIIGKHYIKNNKGQTFIYKPDSFKSSKKIKFICCEGDKCGSFGYYNLITKKFKIIKGHKLGIEKHKLFKVKDRYFIKKLNQKKKKL